MADEARVRASLFLLVVGLSFTELSSAARWSLEKGFGASASHSDAVGASGDRTSGESVLALSPFVSLEGAGLRSNLLLSGEIELQRFVAEDRVEVDPVIFLTSRTTLVESFADIDASARVSRRPVQADPLVGEDLTRFEETEETYEISVSPRIIDTFGSRSDYDARYRFATVRGSGDDLVGSDVHAVSLEVSSLFGDSAISISGDYELASFESDGETRAGSIGLGTSYGFGPSLLTAFEAGYDRIEAGDTGEVIDGEFWDASMRWRPSKRLFVKVGYGNRPYGRKPTASVILSGRRSTIEFSWSRNLAFAIGTSSDTLSSPPAREPDGIADANGVDAEDTTTGGTIEDRPAGEPGNDGSLAPLGRDAGQVDEVVELIYSLSGRRSTLSTSLAWARRESLGDTESAASGLAYGLGLRRVLSRRIEAQADWTAVENESSGERASTRENRFRLSIKVTL